MGVGGWGKGNAGDEGGKEKGSDGLKGDFRVRE